MNIYNSIENIDNTIPSVITVGTFDGVHKGHQQLIARLLEIAKVERLRPVLITLDPHPQLVLQKPDRKPIKLLTVINERLELFEKQGLEHVFIIPFNLDFAKIKPTDFVSDFLVKSFNMQKILIGHDHLFGQNREGNRDLLCDLGKLHGFTCEKIEALKLDDTTVSSSKIRNFLENGSLNEANSMLGYPYLVSGTVKRGAGRGSKIGFPTANVDFNSTIKLMLPNGVYLVSSIINGKKYYGMANLGFRPTFGDIQSPLLEVNYFDFEGDIYGKELSVCFHEYIRKEIKFESVSQLLEQIQKDKEKCYEIKNNFI